MSWGWPVGVEIWLWFLWLQCSTLLDSSSVSFKDFLEGNYYFCLCQERVQTERGILDRVHVPVAVVSAKDSVPEGGSNYKPAVLSYAGPSGHRSEGHWLELSAPVFSSEQAQIHSRHTGTSGQAHIVGYTNTSGQWVLSSVLMHGLEWGVVYFNFNCVVLCISPGLIMSLYGAWVDEDSCMKLWLRAFSGQMRRWRASSVWALLFYLMWSGHGLLLLHHLSWSPPVLASAILNNGFC